MSSWTNLEAALRKHKPDELELLAKAASSDDIKKIEALVDGNKLPTVYADLLHKHNGSIDKNDPFVIYTWDFYSTEQIVQLYSHMKEMLNHADGDFNKPPKGVQPVSWDPLWLPIFMAGDGKEVVCLDFNPASGGTKGQAILVHLHRGPTDNFGTFDKLFKGLVEEEVYELDDDAPVPSNESFFEAEAKPGRARGLLFAIAPRTRR